MPLTSDAPATHSSQRCASQAFRGWNHLSHNHTSGSQCRWRLLGVIGADQPSFWSLPPPSVDVNVSRRISQGMT